MLMRDFLVRHMLAAALMLVPITCGAVTIRDWVGTYEMDHDGWRGTLMITDTKVNCAQPAWCAFALRYRDANGQLRNGRIERMDDQLQHMTFVIAFPDNVQHFDGYLFSHESGRIAGTTYWGGRTFGFYALRQTAGAATVPPDQNKVVSQRILPSGEIERRYHSGIIERIASGRITRIMPDGTSQTQLMQQVIPVNPPPPPPTSLEGTWLEQHAERLLDIIVSLSTDDQNARANYLNSEGNTGAYDRIVRRTQVIGYLARP